MKIGKFFKKIKQSLFGKKNKIAPEIVGVSVVESDESLPPTPQPLTPATFDVKSIQKVITLESEKDLCFELFKPGHSDLTVIDKFPQKISRIPSIDGECEKIFDFDLEKLSSESFSLVESPETAETVVIEDDDCDSMEVRQDEESMTPSPNTLKTNTDLAEQQLFMDQVDIAIAIIGGTIILLSIYKLIAEC